MKSIRSDYLKRQQLLSVAVCLAIQSLALITPRVMGQVIDEYIPHKDRKGIICGIAVFALIPLATTALQALYQYFLIRYVRKKGNELAMDIMRNLVYKESSFFDRENSLELLAYSSKEAVSYIHFYISDLAGLYVNAILSAVIFVILLLLDPWIAVLQLLYVPLAWFPVRKIMGNVDRQVQQIVSTNACVNQIKGDTFKAIAFVKLNCLEEKKLQEVERYNNRINRIWGSVAALDALSGMWSSGFVTVLFTGMTFGLGALLAIRHGAAFQTGQLVSAITYAGLLYTYFNSMLQTNIDRKKKEAEFEKLFSYLRLQGEREANANSLPMTFTDRITFRNCSFGYQKEVPVLKGLSLSFRKGQWTGIVGQSGSGKSTILDLIMKLYPVEPGTVFIDGVDINGIDAFDIRSKVTKITQEPCLFPGTVESNFRLIREDATQEELWAAIRLACLEEYMLSLPQGLQTDVGEAGKLMSGGEKQRLSLAMGLLRKKDVLLLDEITANLDAATECKIAENLKGLADRGYTIISISHKMEFLKYADVIYTIRDGQLS